MGFSLPSSEVAGSTARAIVHPFSEAIIAEPFAERIIPASPSLGFLTDFLEDSFALKRFPPPR